MILLCALGGVTLLTWAFFESRAVLRLRRRGVRTEGTVIDNVPGERRLWVPIVVFTDQRGHRVEFDLGMHTRWKRRIGSTVPVIYLPEQAPEARRNVWWQLWLPTFALVLFGGLLVTAAIGKALELAA